MDLGRSRNLRGLAQLDDGGGPGNLDERSQCCSAGTVTERDAFDHLDGVSNTVDANVLFRVADRLVVDLDSRDACRTEFNRGDGEDRAPGAEVGDEIAATNYAVHQSNRTPRRRMLTSTERR